MTEYLTKAAPGDDSVEQAQFNAAIDLGLLGPITLLDDQLRKGRMDDYLGGGVLSHWAALDPERRRQEINAYLTANVPSGDPLDGYYSEDGKTLNVMGLGLSGSLTIPNPRKAALENILADTNNFSTLGITGVTGLKQLRLRNGGVFGGAKDFTLFTHLTYLSLRGAAFSSIAGYSHLPSLTFLDTSFNTVGAVNLSSNTLLESYTSLVSGLTSLVLPNTATLLSITVDNNAGLTTVDTSDNPNLTQIHAKRCGLTQAAVDALLANAVATGIASGTNYCLLANYAGDPFETNAMASDAGMADVATLRGRGWWIEVRNPA